MRHTLTLLSALLIAVPAWAQLAGRDLQILFNPGGHYVSPFYSGRPSSGSPFVFFDDEPIQVLIRFANWSDETLMLRAGGRSPGEAVSVRLYRISESGPVEVPVRLNIEGALREQVAAQIDVIAALRVQLAAASQSNTDVAAALMCLLICSVIAS